MIERDLEFYALSRLMDDPGIVIDGEIYHIDRKADDATLDIDGKRHSLRYQGNMQRIQSLEEMTRKDSIESFKQRILRQPIDAFFTGNQIEAFRMLFLQLMAEVLPELDEFDSRLNDMPRSDLITTRTREIIAQMPGNVPDKDSELTIDRLRKKILKEISLGTEIPVQELLTITQRYKSGQYVGTSSKRTSSAQEYFGFDFKPTFLLMQHSDHRAEKYSLAKVQEPKDADIVFRRNRHKKLFKQTGKLEGYSVSRLINMCKKIALQVDMAQNLDALKLETLIRYGNAAGVKGLDMDFSYQGAGLRKMSHEDKDRIFLYVKPCGFAMHDIREGFTDRWYPMRTPPEVGILVAAGEEGRYMVEEGTMHFHGDVYVNGTFVYPLFSSQRNTLKSFCGAEKFHRRPGETWQDSMIRTIMFGVDTLFNGMTDDSMIEYSEGGIKGERYHNRLSALEWITEQQVESEGLYKTNLHDTVSARC